MLDPWTFTASAQRMRERDIARMPMHRDPETIGLAPALAIAAALGAFGVGCLVTMYLCAMYLGDKL
jgi:hypothetical protein